MSEQEALGAGADGHTHETACLNCGAVLAGAYCHDCGQHAHVHRTLSAFSHDLLHGALHFEGKLWRTLPLLAWRPGELTRRYIHGQRARFVSPIALFLFSVFLMFAVLGTSLLGSDNSESTADAESSLQSDQRKLAALVAQRTAAIRASQPTTSIDESIAEARQEIAIEQRVRRSIILAGGDSSRTTGESRMRIARTGNEWLDTAIARAEKNPELLLYKVKSSAYKYSWALIPLSVPFLWLLFPFSRRFRVYDHMIFVTYSLAFMTLLVVLAVLFSAIGLTVLAGLLILVPPVHMYRQLKQAYGLSRFGALWRAAALSLFALLALAAFAFTLLGVGILD